MTNWILQTCFSLLAFAVGSPQAPPSDADLTAFAQTTLKKLPIAEKRARAETQAGRLAGLNLVGELEPSHLLIDLANHILETGAIIWIAPSKCLKRDDEIQVAIKERTSSIQIGNSVLRVAQTTSEVRGDTGSELKLP